MNDIYEGDPKLINGRSGSRFEYKGGQPVMDRGIENSVAIDLGTKRVGVHSHQKGWVGNHFLPTEQRIGTDYQDTVENQPQTLAGLATIEQAAKTALSSKLYGDIEPVASNPQADTMINNIKVNSPAGVFIIQTKFSQLWQFQALYPANERI